MQEGSELSEGFAWTVAGDVLGGWFSMSDQMEWHTWSLRMADFECRARRPATRQPLVMGGYRLHERLPLQRFECGGSRAACCARDLR